MTKPNLNWVINIGIVILAAFFAVWYVLSMAVSWLEQL